MPKTYPMLSLPCGEPLENLCRSPRWSSIILSCLPNLWWYCGVSCGWPLWESERRNREPTGLLSGDLDLLLWELEEPFWSPSPLITLCTASTPFAKINLSFPLTIINFSSILILQPLSFSILCITFSVNRAFICLSLAATLSKKSWDLRFAPRVEGHPFTTTRYMAEHSIPDQRNKTKQKIQPTQPLTLDSASKKEKKQNDNPLHVHVSWCYSSSKLMLRPKSKHWSEA